MTESVANEIIEKYWCFWKQVVFCAKKGSKRPTKRSAENIEEGAQRIIAEINPRN
jgi:hypothetical protein